MADELDLENVDPAPWLERELIEAFDADLIEEPAELEADERVAAMLDELAITGSIREAMLRDAGRAGGILRHALTAAKIRNRAAFAIVLWRQKADPRRITRAERELEEEPPSLASLEFVWSMKPNEITVAIERMMTVAIERNGGARELMRRAGLEPLPPQGELPLDP